MKAFKELYKKDIERYTRGGVSLYVKRFHRLLRKCQTSKGIFNKLYRALFRLHCNKRGLEISSKTVIGEGLYLGHAYNITINGSAKLGKNINIHKGVTIGQENRGKRKGTPTIGDNVWIGINATIVGAVSIGSDVLIAPNSYVNCDIPDHSIVFGNPCIIKHRENATEDYINNKVE